MTAVARLLAQKQELLDRLKRDDLGDKERAATKELLTKIDEMLNSLDDAGPIDRT